MQWYIKIRDILEQEPETWLAYLYGQQLENVPHLTRGNRRLCCKLKKLPSFFALLFRHFCIKCPATDSPSKYFVFAGSLNQVNSLNVTIDSLRDQSQRLVAVTSPDFIDDTDQRQRYLPFAFTILDVFKFLFLLSHRGPELYCSLKKPPATALLVRFTRFCSVYGYLIYFQRVLAKTRPEFVITSNDHNAANRCLFAVAHYLGIKTVYLQHASVSKFFPALRMNYAFLDGKFALDIYRECESNQPLTHRKVPEPQIYLTGQKKLVAHRADNNCSEIGFAVNLLDDASVAIEAVRELARYGQRLRLRWHPRQKDSQVIKYLKAFSDDPMVTLSDPKQEAVSDFIRNIGFLVAGNSSIHLEAALAGVIPIYFELGPADHTDYYGFVKNKLAYFAESPAKIAQLVGAGSELQPPSESSVKYYSATFRTQWEGKEGELVAECIISISEGRNPPLLPVERSALKLRSET